MTHSTVLLSDDKSYTILFQPKTKIGKEHLKNKWSKYYTTNIDYLKDSQEIYKKILMLNKK